MDVFQAIALAIAVVFLGVSLLSWIILPFILSTGLEQIKDAINKLGDK